MALKDKLITFDFKFGQFGRIPSSRNKDRSEIFNTFEEGLEKVVVEKLQKEAIKPSRSNVSVFIAQLFQSQEACYDVDIDNIIRSLLNIISGKIFIDDYQVTSLLMTKRYDKSFKDNFYFCGVKFLGSNNDPGYLNKAGLYEAKEFYKSLKKAT